MAHLGFQYAAKFVLGESDGQMLAPGSYFTAINVHNPGVEPVRFRKKVAVALPGQKPGRVSKFVTASLKPDQAFDIDPRDIRKIAGPAEPFFTGFVVIESPMELDVVAVYTAAGAERVVATLALERVPARHVFLPTI